MSESDVLSTIFEMVEAKRAEKAKPKRKKREMSEAQREQMLKNLKKGRETSLAKRRAKKEAKGERGEDLEMMMAEEVCSVAPPQPHTCDAGS